MLVFEDRKGLYGGVDLKGGLLSADTVANLAYYEEALTLKDILFDQKVRTTDATSDAGRDFLYVFVTANTHIGQFPPPPGGVAANGAKIFDLSSSGLVSPTTGGANVTTAAGTAAAPTYSFAGDTGTGWWRPAASLSRWSAVDSNTRAARVPGAIRTAH